MDESRPKILNKSIKDSTCHSCKPVHLLCLEYESFISVCFECSVSSFQCYGCWAFWRWGLVGWSRSRGEQVWKWYPSYRLALSIWGRLSTAHTCYRGLTILVGIPVPTMMSWNPPETLHPINIPPSCICQVLSDSNVYGTADPGFTLVVCSTWRDFWGSTPERLVVKCTSFKASI